MSPLTLIVLLLWLISTAYYFFFKRRRTDKDEKSQEKGSSSSSSSSSSSDGPLLTPIALENFSSLLNRLNPDSRHMDILLALLAMPEILQTSNEEFEKIQELREKKKKQIEEEKKAKKNRIDFDDLLNADGWDNDDDDEDHHQGNNDNNDNDNNEEDLVKKSREEEKRKEEELLRLRKSQGKELPPMEGLDEGVLGQNWVERTLQEISVWPPPLDALGEETFPYQPKGTRRAQQLKPLDHPVFRRCLCMTMGRLHSDKLNTNPQLVEAGAHKLVDETYFKGSMEFRQRIILILDASLRVALSVQSFPLFATLVETLAAFKIGCVPGDPKALPQFNRSMARQYNTLPRLDVGDITFETVQEQHQDNTTTSTPGVENPPQLLSELVAGQQVMIVLPVDRKHAEAFTKVKIAQCQQQGIPPQIALQGYREGWWFLVRWEFTDQKNNTVVPENNDFDDFDDRLSNNNNNSKNQFLNQLDPAVLKRFTSAPSSQRIRSAFPMMVQNVAQKSGSVKVRLTAPHHPGHYKLHLAVKSQDFLGADVEKEILISVVANQDNINQQQQQDLDEEAKKKNQ